MILQVSKYSANHKNGRMPLFFSVNPIFLKKMNKRVQKMNKIKDLRSVRWEVNLKKGQQGNLMEGSCFVVVPVLVVTEHFWG